MCCIFKVPRAIWLRIWTSHHDFKPKYYGPVGDSTKDDFKYIIGDHVVRFYGVMMARIWLNNTSIDNMWLVREILDSVPSVKELMPQDAYKDLYCYMHFVDDWEADSDSKQNLLLIPLS